MIFNSIPFVAFAICVAVAIHAVCRLRQGARIRNVLLLAASYWFYGQFGWAFALLLAAVTVVNYVGALAIGGACANAQQQKTDRRRKTVLWVTVLLSLLPLLTYKYSVFVLCDVLGLPRGEWAASLLLPVGISFYTFQALSYTIDVYRRKTEARRNFVDVALFVAFFPTILSGPIEKARNLLPQIERCAPIKPDRLTSGVTIFIWGLFKKTVIADRLAAYVNLAYINYAGADGSTLALAAVFYSIQIYCDFSGYSDMALGVARCLGFDLTRNFRFPYFSSSIKRFWKCWHISLTSWFTEYVYFSLGGNRVAKWRWVINISMVFLLSGLWHGAAWSFIIWGGMHAVLYLAEHFAGLQGKSFKPGRMASLAMGVAVFALVTVAWVYFRADNAAVATTIVSRAFTCWSGLPDYGMSAFTFVTDLALLAVFLLLELKLWRDDSDDAPMPSRSVVWTALVLLLTALFAQPSDTFVYFQF